jgi:glycopeptide antibiotics resistance protein
MISYHLFALAAGNLYLNYLFWVIYVGLTPFQPGAWAPKKIVSCSTVFAISWKCFKTVEQGRKLSLSGTSGAAP